MDVIKARFSATISCSLRTLYRLGDGGAFLQRRVSLKRKKKDQWAHGNWSLDVIKGTFSAIISCSLRTLYRLGDGDVFSKEEFPWQGKRKPNGHTEKGRKEGFRRNLEERVVILFSFQR